MSLFNRNTTDEPDETDETDDEQPDGEETVSAKITKEVSRDYTEHTAKLLNENATSVREVTFDYMKTKNGRVHLGNYIGVTTGPFSARGFKKETFFSFGVNQYGLETTNREKKTMTSEVTVKGEMARSAAKDADNVEIIE